MKKLALALLVVTNVVNAQQGSKWSTGGNNIGTGDFLGTTNNEPIIFKTNNQTRATLAADGTFQVDNLSVSSGGIALDPNNGISLSKATSNGISTSIFTFGKAFTPPTGIDPCILGFGTGYPTPTAYQFRDLLQVGTTDPTNASFFKPGGSVLSFGSWGSASSIDVSGAGSAGLMINYFCGKNVSICTGTQGIAGPTVSVGNFLYANKSVQIGQGWNPIDPSVALNIMDDAPNGIRLWWKGANNAFSIRNTTDGFKEAFRITGDGKTQINTIAGNNMEALSIGNSVTSAFDKNTVIYSDGSAHFHNAVQIGYPNGTIPNSAFEAFRINAGSRTGIISETTHPGGGGYNTLHIVNHNDTKAIAVWYVPGTALSSETFLVNGDGRTSIGGNYIPNGYMLAVHGKMIAEEVLIKLQSAGWPDYVFTKQHKLMDLAALETFIAENKHLPNIPSAREISEQGLNISDIQVKQMEKIEELTLYIIELKKEIEALKSKK